MSSQRRGRAPENKEETMKDISKKELERLAKEYGRDAGELEDYILDMEGDGIRVTAGNLEDFLANGDI